jgi:hypothetical protein
MRIKETLFYNLKAIVDGTENKIEDVIKNSRTRGRHDDGKVLYKANKLIMYLLME